MENLKFKQIRIDDVTYKSILEISIKSRMPLCDIIYLLVKSYWKEKYV